MDMTNKIDRIRYYAKEFEKMSVDEIYERSCALLIYDRSMGIDEVSDIDIDNIYNTLKDADTMYEYGLREDIDAILECPDIEEMEI